MTAASVEKSTFRNIVEVGPVGKVVEDLGNKGSLWKDCLEGILTCLDWVPYFSASPKNKAFALEVKSQIEPLKMGLGVPQFFASANELRNKFQKIGHTDNPDLSKEIFKQAAATTLHGSESVQFLDAIGVISLKEAGKNLAKGLFWGAALLLDGGDVFTQIENIRKINDKMSKAESADVKSVLDHKLNLAHLSVLKDVTTIAMASIALISIVFASMAHGFIFSPVFFLGLATAWIVLQFATYFYEKAIEVQVDHLKTPGKRV